MPSYKIRKNQLKEILREYKKVHKLNYSKLTYKELLDKVHELKLEHHIPIYEELNRKNHETKKRIRQVKENIEEPSKYNNNVVISKIFHNLYNGQLLGYITKKKYKDYAPKLYNNGLETFLKYPFKIINGEMKILKIPKTQKEKNNLINVYNNFILDDPDAIKYILPDSDLLEKSMKLHKSKI